MKILKYFFFCLFFILSSCIEFVRGNYYDKIDTSKKTIIRKYSESNKISANYIYEITGEQLLKELNKHKKSLVYIFANWCSSETCLPLKTIIDYANNNDLQLYLIMSSYYKVDISLAQNVNIPLYAINAEYYGNTKNEKYIELFKKDIGYNNFVKNENEKWMGNYIIFNNDSIIDIKSKIVLNN